MLDVMINRVKVGDGAGYTEKAASMAVGGGLIADGCGTGRKKRLLLIFCVSMAVTLTLVSFLMQPAMASEGGSSCYTPGTFGDFSMNYAAPGLYFRENLVYVTGKLDNFPLAPTVNGKLEQTTWFNLLNIAYVTENKILGAHYFMTAYVPYIFSSKLKADVPGMVQQEDSTSGLGDLSISPVGLMWNLGNFHITAAENVYLPAGRYNKDNLINVGRNYKSYETDIGLTWLDEKKGHEVSFIAGYMFNSKNQDTDYKTGDEFHIDFALNQYFSENFGLGIVGYYYQQMTDDASPQLDSINQINNSLGLGAPGGYRSKSAGVGPALMWSPAKNVNVIAKWLHEYQAENRFSGDWVYLSLCLKF